MMPGYIRRTSEVALAAVPRELGAYVAQNAERNHLSLDNVRCWLTHSDNPPASGFFGKLFGRRANPVDPNTSSITLVMLHPTHILVAICGDNMTTGGFAAPHLQLSLRHGLAVGRGGTPTQLDGFELTGFDQTLDGSPASYFVGLGSEVASQQCIQALEEALFAAKNPA